MRSQNRLRHGLTDPTRRRNAHHESLRLACLPLFQMCRPLQNTSWGRHPLRPRPRSGSWYYAVHLQQSWPALLRHRPGADWRSRPDRGATRIWRGAKPAQSHGSGLEDQRNEWGQGASSEPETLLRAGADSAEDGEETRGHHRRGEAVDELSKGW